MDKLIEAFEEDLSLLIDEYLDKEIDIQEMIYALHSQAVSLREYMKARDDTGDKI